MRFVTSLCKVLNEPYPKLMLVFTPSSCNRRVTMLITPPMAFEPYNTEAGPRKTSTRSAISDW